MITCLVMLAIVLVYVGWRVASEKKLKAPLPPKWSPPPEKPLEDLLAKRKTKKEKRPSWGGEEGGE